MHIPGIKTENNSRGEVKYLRIDMDIYGDDEFLEDFLDNLAVKNHVRGKCVTLKVIISEPVQKASLKIPNRVYIN
ncbi:hypothetical protein Barb6XT_03034 [Bacteroidales bacterium Barb6XT]|nr:hypothetical protein Barb6XT_03034 [Bacteroidales bacterium Barb6XT]